MKELSIMTQNFSSELFSQGRIELDNLQKNGKNFRVFLELIKISISVLNVGFNTKEPSIYDLLFLVARYPPKNDNKYPSEMRNQDQNSHFAIREVFPVWDPFDDRSKMLTYRQISLTFFNLQAVLQKMQVSQSQSKWFVFQEAVAYKRQGRVVLHTPQHEQGKVSSATATHSYGVRVLLSVIIIAESYTRNIEYVTGQLKKISLEQLLFN